MPTLAIRIGELTPLEHRLLSSMKPAERKAALLAAAKAKLEEEEGTYAPQNSTYHDHLCTCPVCHA